MPPQNEAIIGSDYLTIDTIPQTIDAQAWAKEFLRLNPSIGIDEGTMIGWFANAIMSGYDYALRTNSNVNRQANFLNNVRPLPKIRFIKG